MLLFCHVKEMSEWMARIIRKCSTIGSPTSISNTWLIGHSLGAHLVGYTAKSLSERGHKVKKVIGLDPSGRFAITSILSDACFCELYKEQVRIFPLSLSGPFFAKSIVTGKCHGIQSGYANQTVIFYTNPGELGTEHFDTADVHILSNSKHNFCQNGCDCSDFMCNHFYASKTLLNVLVRRQQLKATYLSDGKGKAARVSIYDRMQPGLYDLIASNNPILKESNKFHEKIEL